MYEVKKNKHCDGCPAHSAADPNNPHVCNWTNASLQPSGRHRVIQIVQKLMHNNPHPWCGFDEHFRLAVVRAAARAVMKMGHGNEESYHDSENQPANFRRISVSQSRDSNDGRSEAIQSSSVEYLASVTARAKEAATEAGQPAIINLDTGEAYEHPTTGRPIIHAEAGKLADASIPSTEAPCKDTGSVA